MSINYTFDEFAKAVKDNNLYMSDADMKLAKQNPSIGMGIVNNKLGFLSAKTDEERAQYHQNTEELRKGAGGYSGGPDGSQYLQYLPTPSSFTYENAPSFSSGYTGEVKTNYDTVKNYGDFSYDVEKPKYNDMYVETRGELIDAILNHGDFSYDYTTDPNYTAYAKQYRREGQRAAADTLAQAAANTGGIASTAAVTASQQAGNYYGAQLADKLPQLYDAAYDRWLDEFTLKQNKLAAVQGESASEYDRYLNDVAQWENDRNFALQQDQEKYNRLLNALEISKALEDSEYAKYADLLDQHNLEQDRKYNQQLDEIAYIRDNEAIDWQNALDIFEKTGDTSRLEALGVDMESYNAQLKQAEDRAAAEALLADRMTQAEINKINAEIAGEKADTEYKNAQTQNVIYNTQIASLDYDTIGTERLLSREEWELAKAAGNPSIVIAGCSSYAEYVKLFNGEE